MSTIDIEELQAHAQDIVTRVERNRETIEIVVRGQVAARLVPPLGPVSTNDAVLADMDRLAAEIQTVWPEGVSAVDAVREGRNRLDEDPATRCARIQASLDRLKQIGKEISATWPEGVSAVDAVRDVRREL